MLKRRPLLNTNVENRVSVTQTETGVQVEYSGLSLEKRLRKKRSVKYVEAIAKLDAGAVQHKHGAMEQLIEVIGNEFPDLESYQFPIGIIAKCYLGDEYEVHTLNITLDIIQHFKKGESLPLEVERGKSIALHPSYEFIEVYSDTLRAVDIHGNVSIIKG